jgi:hypothetical protein
MFFCEFQNTIFAGRCDTCQTKCADIREDTTDILFKFLCFKSLGNFFKSIVASCNLFCYIIPVSVFIFTCFANCFTQLICCCPPLAIIFLALPWFRGKQYNVYSFLEKRIDSDESQYRKWHQTGWVRVFFISCVLTLFGFFPGVFFVFGVTIYHMICIFILKD